MEKLGVKHLALPEGPKLAAVKPVDLAQQLTLSEHELIRNIKPREFVRQAWSKKDSKYSKAPNIIRYIENFNKTCNWFSAHILDSAQPSKRAEVVEFIIRKFPCFLDVHSIPNMR